MIGRFFDGITAEAHPAVLKIAGGMITGSTPAGDALFDWPVSALTVLDDKPSHAVLSARHAPAVRLHMTKQDFERLRRDVGDQANLKSLNRTLSSRWLWGMGGGVLAALVLVYFSIPLFAQLLAPAIPDSWMADLGERTMDSMTAQAECTAEPGIQALESLLVTLIPDNAADETPITVTVVDRNVVNALAVPGRHVVFFSGLIAEAEAPEEIAGILAHEIGHHQANHLKEQLVNQVGLSLLSFMVIGTDGGVLATMGLELAGLSYSRADEREADAIALELMDQANISPAGLKRFFERLAAKSEEAEQKTDTDTDTADGDSESKAEDRGETVWQILSTHPASKERADAITVDANRAYTPALTEAQWQAVKDICAEG